MKKPSFQVGQIRGREDPPYYQVLKSGLYIEKFNNPYD